MTTPENELATAKRQTENWRDVALYFADILAASASMLLDRKTTSKSERRRQESIVRSALSNLSAGYVWDGRRSQIEFVRERLERALKSCGGSR